MGRFHHRRFHVILVCLCLTSPVIHGFMWSYLFGSERQKTPKQTTALQLQPTETPKPSRHFVSPIQFKTWKPIAAYRPIIPPYFYNNRRPVVVERQQQSTPPCVTQQTPRHFRTPPAFVVAVTSPIPTQKGISETERPPTTPIPQIKSDEPTTTTRDLNNNFMITVPEDGATERSSITGDSETETADPNIGTTDSGTTARLFSLPPEMRVPYNETGAATLVKKSIFIVRQPFSYQPGGPAAASKIGFRKYPSQRSEITAESSRVEPSMPNVQTGFMPMVAGSVRKFPFYPHQMPLMF